MQHPYLYFSRQDVLNFREKIRTDAEARARYEASVASAEDCLKEEVVTWERLNGRESLHANFGELRNQADRWARVLGSRYLVEGDERCAEKLKALLAAATSYERWYAHSYVVRKPVPWHSDLCSTGTTLALCTVFDMIHDYLTPTEQDDFAKKIVALGVKPALGDWCLPENRIHAVDSMGHNWWAVCIGESAQGLLALQDHLPADWVKETLRQVNDALAAFFTYPGNTLFNKLRNYADGLFYESISYFEYGTCTPLRYLYCYERYFGENAVMRRALPDGMADAMMTMSYPYTKKDGKKEWAFVNYGDAGMWETRTGLCDYLNRLGLGNSATRAYMHGRPVGLWDEIAGFSNDYPNDTVGSLPRTRFFSSGYMMTRDSWEPDGTMFTLKSGFCWNHSHNDSGSFTIYHKGRPVIPDNGCCDYDNPLYHAYYCQDLAHNVIRIGGKGRRDEELYRGTKFPGRLIDNYDTGDCLFVQADCTGPMAHLCSRLYRNYFWINNRILVLLDDVYTHVEDTVDFALHYVGELTPKDGTYFIDDGDNHTALRSHFPQGMTYKSVKGHADHHPETEEPYLELSTVVPGRTGLLIHSLELDCRDFGTSFRNLTDTNCDGIAIDEGDKTYEIWFNHMADGHVMHDNANNVVAGFDTDAYILFITRDKKQGSEKVMAVCCSYLRRNGRVYLAEFIKTTREVNTTDR